MSSFIDIYKIKKNGQLESDGYIHEEDLTGGIPPIGSKICIDDKYYIIIDFVQFVDCTMNSNDPFFVVKDCPNPLKINYNPPKEIEPTQITN